jgi:hypothetical protein
MIPWTTIMLALTVGAISWVDIRTRFVSPLLILPLLLLTLIGWSSGLWGLSLIGGLMGGVAAWLIRLPLGDVFGLFLCGLLAGPLPTMTALMVSTLGIAIFLAVFGHRVSLVRHPFFPYCGALVLIFSRLFSGG